MEEYISIRDKKVKEILNNLKKQVPDVRCPAGKKVIKLCVYPHCKSALRCGDKECKNCSQTAHRICNAISLEEFTQKINEKVE